jgi:uncharacterized protein (TIGR02588 family)
MKQNYKPNLLPTPSRSLAEKVSFGISLAILGFVLALIIYTWITGDNKPPILNAKVSESIYQENNQFYVPFIVTNTGGKTAESVEVQAKLTLQEEIIETGTQQIDYLSGGEEESGSFIFTHNPNGGQLQIRVASFKLP